jgi:hypothetical protein
MTSGAKTAKNLFRSNSIFDTPGTALMIHDGTENVIIGNEPIQYTGVMAWNF